MLQDETENKMRLKDVDIRERKAKWNQNKVAWYSSVIAWEQNRETFKLINFVNDNKKTY